MKKIDVRIMTISGFLIALNIILSSIITIPGVINFGGFPIIFAGIVFGPVVGGMVGAIGDIISFIVRPTGAFMPHFVLTSASYRYYSRTCGKASKKQLKKFTAMESFHRHTYWPSYYNCFDGSLL